MNRIDWKNQNITYTRDTHPKLQNQLSLTLPWTRLEELRIQLQETLTKENEELKVDLPKKWTLYWKMKPGASRLSLAHPAADEWVASLLLSREHGEKLLTALEKLEEGSSLALSQLTALGPFSNFELVITRKE
jgi:hypothetical protein